MFWIIQKTIYTVEESFHSLVSRTTWQILSQYIEDDCTVISFLCLIEMSSLWIIAHPSRLSSGAFRRSPLLIASQPPLLWLPVEGGTIEPQPLCRRRSAVQNINPAPFSALRCWSRTIPVWFDTWFCVETSGRPHHTSPSDPPVCRLGYSPKGDICTVSKLHTPKPGVPCPQNLPTLSPSRPTLTSTFQYRMLFPPSRAAQCSLGQTTSSRPIRNRPSVWYLTTRMVIGTPARVSLA